MEEDSAPRTYRFALSLCLRHPSARVGDISAALGREPMSAWTVGDKMTHSEHLHWSTYWCERIPHDDSAELSDALWKGVTALQPHRKILRDFASTGGKIYFSVGWFTTTKSGGDTLTAELLGRLADLRIGLEFDVYGNE